MYNQLNQVRHPAGADVVLVISDAAFVSLVVEMSAAPPLEPNVFSPKKLVEFREC